MSNKPLVVVESPTKAKTIGKFLGKEYTVTASNGHIRDLPNSADEIPEKWKKEKWTRLGVNIENDFEPFYVIPSNKAKHVKRLKDLVRNASELLLATDEDREGESISWHLREALKPKIPVKRLVFHEITKDAIKHALDTPREIDENLVRAQETRRIVDRLFGYEVSPILWKKMSRGLSAGRVQSVAVRLLVERERERIAFHTASYWTLKATFETGNGIKFESDLANVDGQRIAVGKDFDPSTGKLKNTEKVVAFTEDQIDKLLLGLQGKPIVVSKVQEKPYSSKPAPPFVTSTLQQEGNRKLRLTAKHTMGIAQQLYENGFITYMRTDSTSLSSQAIEAARSFIVADYGKEYLPEKPRVYVTKVKNAQEAHEAIRPAGDEFTPPSIVKEKLGIEAFKLYDLIWKRTVACQMEDARGKRSSVSIQCEGAEFRSSGKTIEFPGYLRAYVEGSDDPDSDLADQEKILPTLNEQEKLSSDTLEKQEKTTQPPARYTEGSIIKELETKGIGRPSTWASIVDLVMSRAYAFKRGPALIPTFTAVAVVGLLEKSFAKFLDYEFTAGLEDDLDAISRGEAGNIAYLKSFYHGDGYPGLKTLIDIGIEEIDPREVCGIPIGKDPEGLEVEVRIGRYGPFITNGTVRSSVPDMTAPEDLNIDAAIKILKDAELGPQSLGEHPETKLPIYLKTGRFGPYLQMGEKDDDTSPKTSSLLPGMEPAEVDFDLAIKLLELPRDVGKHPETNEPIIIDNGRYGPYIKSGTDTRTIPMDEMSPLTMTYANCMELFSRPKTRGRGSTPKSLKDLGAHPVSEKTILIKSGRFGPYVTDGEINASLRKGMDPESITMEDAVNLLSARADKIAANGTGKKSKKKAAKKKSAKKKTVKKKTAKKKTAKKKTVKKKAATKKT